MKLFEKNNIECLDLDNAVDKILVCKWSQITDRTMSSLSIIKNGKHNQKCQVLLFRNRDKPLVDRLAPFSDLHGKILSLHCHTDNLYEKKNVELIFLFFKAASNVRRTRVVSIFLSNE